MAGSFKKFLDFIKLGADDEDLYDEDVYEEEEEPEPVVTRSSRRRTLNDESSSSYERTKRTGQVQSDTSDNHQTSYTRREQHNSRTAERSNSRLYL